MSVKIFMVMILRKKKEEKKMSKLASSSTDLGVVWPPLPLGLFVVCLFLLIRLLFRLLLLIIPFLSFHLLS